MKTNQNANHVHETLNKLQWDGHLIQDILTEVLNLVGDYQTSAHDPNGDLKEAQCLIKSAISRINDADKKQ